MTEKDLFFFKIVTADLLDFATDPEGENMTLLQFAKELKKGKSDIKYIQSIIDEALNYKENKRKAGKKGGLAKASSAKAKPSSAIADPKQSLADPYPETETETETETKEKTNTAFVFKKSLLQLCDNKQLVDDFMAVRKTKKATNSQTAFSRLVSKINESGRSVEEVLTICCEKDWKGFDERWMADNGKNKTQEKQPKYARDSKGTIHLIPNKPAAGVVW